MIGKIQNTISFTRLILADNESKESLRNATLYNRQAQKELANGLGTLNALCGKDTYILTATGNLDTRGCKLVLSTDYDRTIGEARIEKRSGEDVKHAFDILSGHLNERVDCNSIHDLSRHILDAYM